MEGNYCGGGKEWDDGGGKKKGKYVKSQGKSGGGG